MHHSRSHSHELVVVVQEETFRIIVSPVRGVVRPIMRGEFAPASINCSVTMPRVKSSSSRRGRASVGIIKSFSQLLLPERAVMAVLLAMSMWGLIQIAWQYPASFFPRFADEGIYALDARVPSSIFDQFKPGMVRYAPAKLGYGIPLAASVAVAGPNGPMYLSTLLWLATIVSTGVIAMRRLGLVPSVIAVAFLSYSAIFGKYVTDVGPTSEAAFAFVLFWGASCTRRSWLVGLAIGFIAFIDFKWAVPAGLAYVLIELVVEVRESIGTRIRRLATATVVALSAIGVAILLHRPYGKFLAEYVFPHSGLIVLEPSPILVYYLMTFGSLAAVVVAGCSLMIPGLRRDILTREQKSGFPLARALCIFAVPVIFYSVLGELKALRFFAVPFPLLAVLLGFTLSTVIRSLSELTNKAVGGRFRTAVGAVLLALVGVAVVHGGSRGPADHLTLPTGYPEALDRLRAMGAKGGTVSSYNWPAVAYGWPEPFPGAPFAYIGLQKSDKWVALDPALDRATIELRIRLGRSSERPDSVWEDQSRVYHLISDSLFSVRSDFNASDYYLCEMVPDGVNVLRSWRTIRPGENYLTVRSVNSEKLKSFESSRR